MTTDTTTRAIVVIDCPDHGQTIGTKVTPDGDEARAFTYCRPCMNEPTR